VTGIQAGRGHDDLHGAPHGLPTDVRRRGNEFVIEVDLPGVRRGRARRHGGARSEPRRLDGRGGVYTDGVLTLTIPVGQTAKSQRIDVKGGAGGGFSSPPLDDPSPSEPPQPEPRPDESAKLPPY
jgi:hypothetical protein